MSSVTTAIAVASLAAGVAGTAMSAAGQARQQEAAAQAATYQAGVAAAAKQVADWEAADALKRGEVAEEQRGIKTRLQIGSQRAALASSGTDVNDGSNVDIVGDTAAAGKFDALTIRNNAERESWDRKVQGNNYAAASALDTAKAESATSAIGLGVGANLLAGGASVADKWSVYKSKGIFGGGTNNPELSGTGGLY